MQQRGYKMEEEQRVSAWDARQKYSSGIVYRLHLYLDVSINDLKQKHDRLWDFLDSGISKINQKKRIVIKRNLYKIEGLVHKKGANHLEINKNKLMASKLIRETYEEIHAAFDKAGLFTPTQEYISEVDKFIRDF